MEFAALTSLTVGGEEILPFLGGVYRREECVCSGDVEVDGRVEGRRECGRDYSVKNTEAFSEL